MSKKIGMSRVVPVDRTNILESLAEPLLVADSMEKTEAIRSLQYDGVNHWFDLVEAQLLLEHIAWQEQQINSLLGKPKNKNLYVIECSTGCSCCCEDEFTRGFYQSKEEAEAVAAEYRQGINNPLCSRHSKYGIYQVHEWEVEVLPDGRVISGERVYPSEDLQDRIESRF